MHRNLLPGLVSAIAAALISLAPSSSAAADVPQTLTHQGRLYDASGNAVTGIVEVEFNIYDAPDAGVAIWTEKLMVTFDEGYFSVQLGATKAFTGVFDGSVRYFGIKVGADPEMAPRVAIRSVPYAMVAGNAIGDITPTSVSIGGTEVINATGDWVGNPTGLIGPTGPQGDPGAMGPAGPTGAAGPAGATGPTGPAGAVGPTGAQGAQGPMGLPGATGPAGAAGPAGATGIVATATFNGFAGSGPFTGTNAYAFVGPTASVTVAAGQRLTASAIAPLATTTGTAAVYAGICYQPSAGGALTNFVGGAFSVVQIGTVRTGTPAAASVTNLTAGTYNVGFCMNPINNTIAINSNDYVNGWVHVTN